MIAHDFSSRFSIHRFALLACALLGLLAAALAAAAFLSTPSAHADWGLKSAKLTVGSGWHPIFYIYGKENESAVNALIEQLPPLYNDVANIRFMQIPSGN